MADKSEQTAVLNYADELAKKVLSNKKSQKNHYSFLKNLNDLLAATLDSKEIAELEKEVSNHFNNRVSASHKKKKVNPVKVNMKNEDIDEDYADEDDDYSNYKSFK